MPNVKIQSHGHCLYCNKLMSRKTINRHLQAHLNEKAKVGKAGRSYLLKVVDNPRWGSGPYFLSLWVDSKTTMGEIDYFLKDIWLECCGHMSSFTNPKNIEKGNIWDFFEAQNLLMSGKKKAYEKMMEDVNGEIHKERKAHGVLSKGLKLIYDYDFGSTTSLQITVVDEFPIPSDQPIVLLSRNEPLQWLCDICEKEPATQLCSVCEGYEESFFCPKCAKKHAKTCDDFADYAAMPVVNSPRMGVCGYTGGRIDKKRDGAYAKK